MYTLANGRAKWDNKSSTPLRAQSGVAKSVSVCSQSCTLQRSKVSEWVFCYNCKVVNELGGQVEECCIEMLHLVVHSQTFPLSSFERASAFPAHIDRLLWMLSKAQLALLAFILTGTKCFWLVRTHFAKLLFPFFNCHATGLPSIDSLAGYNLSKMKRDYLHLNGDALDTNKQSWPVIIKSRVMLPSRWWWGHLQKWARAETESVARTRTTPS